MGDGEYEQVTVLTFLTGRETNTHMQSDIVEPAEIIERLDCCWGHCITIVSLPSALRPYLGVGSRALHITFWSGHEPQAVC